MAVLLGGLSLEQYAGVTAALAESFELTEILAQEGIEETAWPDASHAWTEAIVRGPDLQIELIQKRRIAEDCLGRPIAPLDQDPAAWAGLLGALAVTDAPSTVTDALGITMGDIARLGRKWRAKMEADPELAKKVAELAPTAKPPTKIDAGPRALQPFPWTPATRLDAAAKEASRERPSLASMVAAADNKSAAAPRRELASFQLKEQAPDTPTPVAAPPQAPIQNIPQAPQPVVIAGLPPLPPALAAQMTAWAPSDAPTQAVTPFEALEPGAHGISLLKYAQLITLIQEPGANAAAILAGWGLDAAKHRAIEEHYNKKFTREARWATEFGRLIVQAQKTMKEKRAAAAPPGPTRPPRSTAPELNMEQYAWVTATIRKTPPEKLKEVLGRLRLTPETHAELDARWRARMAAEPGLSEALGALVKRHLFAGAPPAAPAAGPPQPGPPSPERGSSPPPPVKAPELPRAPNRLQGTAIAAELPIGPATPFVNRPNRPK